MPGQKRYHKRQAGIIYFITGIYYSFSSLWTVEKVQELTHPTVAYYMKTLVQILVWLLGNFQSPTSVAVHTPHHIYTVQYVFEKTLRFHMQKLTLAYWTTVIESKNMLMTWWFYTYSIKAKDTPTNQTNMMLTLNLNISMSTTKFVLSITENLLLLDSCNIISLKFPTIITVY